MNCEQVLTFVDISTKKLLVCHVRSILKECKKMALTQKVPVSRFQLHDELDNIFQLEANVFRGLTCSFFRCT